jgi:serine/threonine protein kinase
MELSVQNVYGLLIRSRLLALDDAKKMYDRWMTEAKNAGDVGGFAKWMVANHFVTEYQAALLARGHADNFYLGEYKLLDRIGKGRMAGVYKAVHPLGQIVAIKVLPPSKAKESRTVRRFQREARLAMNLKHPNVVRTFHVGESNGLHYLVMEHLDGETLDEVLARRGKLPPAEAVRLVHQALTGLQHIHEQGLVHRDLKPGNLMLIGPRIDAHTAPIPLGEGGEGRVRGGQPDTTLRAAVKIIDIGLARPHRSAGLREGLSNPGITSTGTLLGTPNYMAPEQARDPRSADIRADIYSLGCVLYHALTGQPPFPDTNIINQMIRHATEPPRPLKELNSGVPDGLQQIVNWMLAKDSARRYATPSRAAQALQVFLVAGSEGPSAEHDPKLRSYLTWLETEGNGKVAPSATAPLAGQTPAAPTPRRSRKHKRRQAKTAVSLPFKPPAAVPVPAFDVELVPLPTADVPPSAARSGLSRREFVAFGLGAGSVLLAIVIGWVMALLFRKSPAADRRE